MFQKFLSQIQRYFWTGLIIIIPAWGTFLILYTLFDALDHMTVDVFQAAFHVKVPGSGIASFAILVLLVGMGMTHFVGHRIHTNIEESVEKVPLVRSIYNTLKSMADVINFKERFGQSKVAVFPFPRDGLWAVGFIMGYAPRWLQVSHDDALVMVFVPTAIHPFTGYLAFIPEYKIHLIRLRPEEAMKLEFSAGLYRPSPGWLNPPSSSA
ncbi:DUF502 domain-containing protein [Nitrospira sp. M1]